MSDDERVRDAGYDDFLDAVEDGEPYYLAGSDGNGWLPPRIRDPEDLAHVAVKNHDNALDGVVNSRGLFE